MSEFSPAERLARAQHPDWDQCAPSLHAAWRRDAQRAIDAGWMDPALAKAKGWTPPPDRHEDIARALWAAMDGRQWGVALAQNDLLAAVRRIPDDLAAQVADALRTDQ